MNKNEEKSISIGEKFLDLVGEITEVDEREISPSMGKKKINTTSYKSFHYLEDGSVEFSILSTQYTRQQLDNCVYDLFVVVDGGRTRAALKINDSSETFNNELSFYFVDKVNKIYNCFFNNKIKESVHTLGYNHKLGILLYGKAGTGKTSMFKKYFKDAVETHNSLVFNISHYDCLSTLTEFIRDIRKIQDNPIIVFMDECDVAFYDYNYESTMKTFMDGFSSIDNCMFMLATNYIDKIPKSIKERPSRIKYCIEVKGIEDEEVINRFLKNSFEKVGLEVDFSEDIKGMIGNTIDELKQWVLDKIMDIEPDEKSSSMGFKI